VSRARVSIVRCGSYERSEVKAAVRRAVELIGGAERFLPEAGGVLLKPNLLWASARERRVCTDPEVVRAAAELLRDAGAREISAGDSPGMGPGTKVMRRCGWDGVVPDWLRRVDFESGRPHPSPTHPDLELAAAALDAGLLVNLPKVKTHAYMGLTLAVKNLFGCVVGTRKARWHLRAGENRELFARLLVEIACSFRPGLVIVDGVIGMEGNGPGSGRPRDLGLIVSGDNPSAVDAVLCRIVGFEPAAVPTLAAARDLAAGSTELSEIEVLGESIEDVAVPQFLPAASNASRLGVGIPWPLKSLLRSALTSRPRVNPDLCQRCARCAEMCPPKAITMDAAAAGLPRIDSAACIRCFCCQEVCPHGAITARPGWLQRLTGPFRHGRS
jgi:uncharacterized protein (DUF362 family)/Pyruvate/2-oxoacid:ferredoxin oxidoreductase delta subunit